MKSTFQKKCLKGCSDLFVLLLATNGNLCVFSKGKITHLDSSIISIDGEAKFDTLLRIKS